MIYNMGKGGKVNDVIIDGVSILDAQGVADIGDTTTITLTATDGTTKTITVLKIEEE